MRDAARELLHPMKFTRLTVEDVWSRNWASATFTGTRQVLTFRLEGEAAEEEADTFLAGLDEREFELRGHILADIALLSRTAISDGVRICLEALIVEDA